MSNATDDIRKNAGAAKQSLYILCHWVVCIGACPFDMAVACGFVSMFPNGNVACDSSCACKQAKDDRVDFNHAHPNKPSS